MVKNLRSKLDRLSEPTLQEKVYSVLKTLLLSTEDYELARDACKIIIRKEEVMSRTKFFFLSLIPLIDIFIERNFLSVFKPGALLLGVVIFLGIFYSSLFFVIPAIVVACIQLSLFESRYSEYRSNKEDEILKVIDETISFIRQEENEWLN